MITQHEIKEIIREEVSADIHFDLCGVETAAERIHALASKPDEWGTIETAPTMEAILVYGGEAKYPVVASWSGMRDEPWRLDALGVTSDEIDRPTHWMRLPDDPKSTGEAA